MNWLKNIFSHIKGAAITVSHLFEIIHLLVSTAVAALKGYFAPAAAQPAAP